MIKKWHWLAAAATAAVAAWIGVRWMNSLATPSHPLGLVDGQLAGCPDRPNCVSTQSAQAPQRMPALPIKESVAATLQRLETVIRSFPRSRIASQTDTYLHAEFRSRVFGFVDDLELAIDEPAGLVHFRSASRVGHSDLGVNRHRMEEIRRRYLAP